MNLSNNCILRLIFNSNLYDEVTDALLGFPERELSFLSVEVQSHSSATAHNAQSITEQVSGFKVMRMIEVTTDAEEAKRLNQHLMEQLPQASIQAQLLPLLTLC
ncbi:MAG: DUF3240 domain-containing protein [Gammaproteobacteria bacterium]|nr:DUF3240 domain-containing protein [Gammaproteobacteria bacterium]